jgi:MinD-like ATPase involved in chromosome partitioning or flagellar assembly
MNGHMETKLQLNTKPFSQLEKWHSNTGRISIKKKKDPELSQNIQHISDITLKYEIMHSDAIHSNTESIIGHDSGSQ